MTACSFCEKKSFTECNELPELSHQDALLSGHVTSHGTLLFPMNWQHLSSSQNPALLPLLSLGAIFVLTQVLREPPRKLTPWWDWDCFTGAPAHSAEHKEYPSSTRVLPGTADFWLIFSLPHMPTTIIYVCLFVFWAWLPTAFSQSNEWSQVRTELQQYCWEITLAAFLHTSDIIRNSHFLLFISSPLTLYRKLWISNCKCCTCKVNHSVWLGIINDAVPKWLGLSSALGKACMASGPDKWPTVVTLYSDRRKSQPAVPATAKGLNFYTEQADKLGDVFRTPYGVEMIK